MAERAQTDFERIKARVEYLLAHPAEKLVFLQRAGVVDTLGRRRVQRMNKVSILDVDWQAARESLESRR